MQAGESSIHGDKETGQGKAGQGRARQGRAGVSVGGEGGKAGYEERPW